MNQIARLPVLVCVLVGFNAMAGWSLKGEPAITFNAQGNIGLKFEGKTNKATVADDGKSVTVAVALKDLDTDVGLRNRHMLEDLEAEKYPTVTLTVPAEALASMNDGKSAEGDAKGTLTLHGKSEELPFHYKTNCTSANACDVDATAALNVKHYDIKVRSYAGITVKPDVSIRAKLSLTK